MATEKRLIDANALVIEELLVRNPFEYPNEYASGIRKVMNAIRRLPIVDAEKVVHGRWVIHSCGHGVYANNWAECSECGTCGSPQWKRCPVCEAKMDKEDNNGNET